MREFTGDLSFHLFEDEPPSALTILNELNWDVNQHNAAYLAGKANQPSHELVELTADQAFGTTPRESPQDLSEADKSTIVGDISHTLSADSNFFIACTSDFKQAEEFAEKMDFRPALAGEFLQLLWWLRQRCEKIFGWFYCYAGRMPQYAILADYNGHQNPSFLSVTFDTHIGNEIEEGCVSANMGTFCFFVRKS